MFNNIKTLNRVINFYYSLPIKRKISLSFILISLLLLIFLTIVVNKLSSNTVINKTIENTNQNLGVVTEKLEMLCDSVESYSKTAISHSEVQEILGMTQDRTQTYDESIKIQAVLSNVIEDKASVDAMIIYQFNNNIFDSGNISKIKYPVEKSMGILDRLKGTNSKSLWLDTQKSFYAKDGSNKNIIPFIRSFNSVNTGTPLGIIEICISESTISGLYSKIKAGETGSIFIVNNEGMIISHNDKSMLYKNTADMPYFNWLTKNTADAGIFNIGTEKYLVAKKYFKRIGWFIVSTTPVAEITVDSVRLTNNIFLIGLICIIISILLSEWVSYSITKPITKLKEAIKSVGQGDFEVRAEVKFKDEVGVLSEEFNKMVNRTSALMDRIVKEQKSKREYELAMLQAQINPHFLYNTLDSIGGLIELDRKDEASDTLDSLAAFYRGVLSKGINIIPLRAELKITENYLKILKVRYNEHFDYSFNIDDGIGEYLVIKLCLQPLVENSIYYGIRNKTTKGNVTIKGYASGGSVFLSVIDNGIGMKPGFIKEIFSNNNTVQYQSRSFGLKSTDERIKLYFGSEYGLNIKSIYGEGTEVEIVLPAKKAEDIGI